MKNNILKYAATLCLCSSVVACQKDDVAPAPETDVVTDYSYLNGKEISLDMSAISRGISQNSSAALTDFFLFVNQGGESNVVDAEGDFIARVIKTDKWNMYVSTATFESDVITGDLLEAQKWVDINNATISAAVFGKTFIERTDNNVTANDICKATEGDYIVSNNQGSPFLLKSSDVLTFAGDVNSGAVSNMGVINLAFEHTGALLTFYVCDAATTTIETPTDEQIEAFRALCGKLSELTISGVNKDYVIGGAIDEIKGTVTGKIASIGNFGYTSVESDAVLDDDIENNPADAYTVGQVWVNPKMIVDNKVTLNLTLGEIKLNPVEVTFENAIEASDYVQVAVPLSEAVLDALK